MKERQDLPKWQKALREKFAKLPDASEARIDSLVQMREVFHAEIAEAARPAINAELRARDHVDPESRAEMCAWTNDRLRDLGLSVCCPRTGKSSTLFSDVWGKADTKGRIRLQHFGNDGRLVRTLTSATLPTLDFMQSPARDEAFVRLHRKNPRDRSR